MEYDQAETVDFTEKRTRRFSIAKWTMIFFLFGVLCILSTYWFLKMPNVVFSEKNQPLLGKMVDEDSQASPSIQESEIRSEEDNELIDLNRRIVQLEKSFIDEALELDTLSSESNGMIENLRDLQQSVVSIQKEVQGLGAEREGTQISQTVLLLSEIYLNRAYGCLEFDGRVAKCLDQVKSAEELLDFLPDDLSPAFLGLVKNYRIWLEDLYQRSLQAQTNDFDELVVLISELATAKTAADPGHRELNQQAEEELEKGTKSGLSSSILEALKGLVVVKKIDHQLLNQYSAGEANLIKLSFQLEGATARIAFLTNDDEATQISINNLKKLSDNYLDEATPLARLISNLEAKRLATPPVAKEKLGELRLKIRELRQSPRFLN